jgi:hypothetical protein
MKTFVVDLNCAVHLGAVALLCLGSGVLEGLSGENESGQKGSKQIQKSLRSGWCREGCA